MLLTLRCVFVPSIFSSVLLQLFVMHNTPTHILHHTHTHTSPTYGRNHSCLMSRKRQVRLFSPILQMTALALERDMDTLFSNLPIIRQRFK